MAVTSSDGSAAPDVRSPWMWGRLLVLLGLTGFAIAQPLLDILGSNPSILVFHGVGGATLVLVSLAIALVPPLVLWAIELVVRLVSARAAQVVHLAFVGLLAACIGVQLVKWVIGVDLPVVLVASALIAGAGFAFAYARVRLVRDWSRYTVVMPVLAVVLFLAASSSSALLRSPSASVIGDGDERLAPVVFVLFDELPTKTLLDDQGMIDPIRFPNLAAFAGDATWYRHHTSVAPFSEQAIPTYVTGREPALVDPLWVQHPDNLFSLLAPIHKLSVHESFTQLCGVEQCVEGRGSSARGLTDLGQTVLDLWVDRVSPAPAEEPSLDDFTEEVVPRTDSPQPLDPELGPLQRITTSPERANDFMDAIEGPGTTALYFLHVVLPHSPFRLYPNGSGYDPFAAFPGGVRAPSGENVQGEWITALSEQRHIWQTSYADALFGQLVATLKDRGIYDDALVVFAADHGASFVPDTSYREMDARTIGDIAYAPLMIKAPRQAEGRIDDANLMSFDITPTIADILGVDIPWVVQGAPAGSDAVAARGTEKRFWDITGGIGSALRLREVLVFDDTVEMPAASERFVRPARPGDQPLQALLERVGAADHLGAPLPSTTASAPVRVDDLDLIRAPRGAHHGWVGGQIDQPVDGGVVLVEVNGTVVSGSPLYAIGDEQGYFAALLPEGALGERNEVRFALATPDGSAVELVPAA